MTELLVVLVVAFLVVAGATVLEPRLGIAAPLLLVGVGVAASFLPIFGSVRVEPDWILDGILRVASRGRSLTSTTSYASLSAGAKARPWCGRVCAAP